jgi:hypothetical protein
MRRRIPFVLILLLAIAVRVIPCEAMTATAEARHDCCEESGCPDMVTTGAGHHEPQHDTEACCAMSETRRQHQDSRVLTAVTAVAPPVQLIQFMQPLTVVLTAAKDTGPATAHPAPLHLLFSVLLI